jgi:hypothetical protein
VFYYSKTGNFNFLGKLCSRSEDPSVIRGSITKALSSGRSQDKESGKKRGKVIVGLPGIVWQRGRTKT